MILIANHFLYRSDASSSSATSEELRSITDGDPVRDQDELQEGESGISRFLSLVRSL